MQGPNLFTYKIPGPLSASQGAGFCSLMLRVRAEPSPCPVLSTPSCPSSSPDQEVFHLPLPCKNLISLRLMHQHACSVCTLGCFCTAGGPGLRAGLWERICVFAHSADVWRAHRGPGSVLESPSCGLGSRRGGEGEEHRMGSDGTTRSASPGLPVSRSP